MNRLHKDEADQPKVALTPENVHQHPDATPEMLHSFVQGKLAAPNELHGTDHAELSNVSNHPNASGPTLESMYNHYFPKPAPGVEIPRGPGTEDVDYGTKDTVFSILGHINTPASVAEDFLNRTHLSDDYNTQALHAAASEHPGMTAEKLQQWTDQAINDPNTKADDGPKFNNMHPDYYFGLMTNRPMPQPYMATMPAEHRQLNEHVKKIDNTFLNGIAKTPKHTPESLNRTVDFLTQDRPHGMSAADDTMYDFVTSQPKISSAQLEKLAQVPVDDNYRKSALAAILKHPNVDSGLVAKYALKEPESAWGRDEVLEAALSSPKLPDETKANILSQPELGDRQVRGLLSNPNISSEDIQKIYDKGHQADAIQSDKATPELVEKYYNENQTPAGVRNVLRRDTVPTAVLTHIVSKQKNQAVAIEALGHKSVNLDVLNAALKRRAVKVQDAAMKHPLVAKQLLVKRLTDGMITPWDFVSDPEIKKALGGFPPEAVQHIHEQYTPDKMSNPALQNDAAAWSTKNVLASEPGIDSKIQTANRKDMIDYALENSEVDAHTTDAIHMMVENHVRELAARGDHNAQMAMAQRPIQISEMDMTNDKLSPEFLRSAFDITKRYEGKIPDKNAWRKDTMSFNNQHRRMAENPNLPQDLFDKVTLHPTYIQSPDQYSGIRGRQTYYGGKPARSESTETVFDKRYQGLPEEQRRAGFQKLLEGPHAVDGLQAVVRSTQAPQDLWTKAWNELSPSGRGVFLKNYELGTYAGDDVIHAALLGKYNSEQLNTGLGYGSIPPHTPQDQAFEALDPKNATHRQFLADYVAGDKHTASDIASLNPGFFKGPTGRDLAALALDKMSDPARGVDMALAHVANTYGSISSYGDTTPSDEAPMVNQQRLAAVKGLIDEAVQKLPADEQDATRNIMWGRVITSSAIGGSKISLASKFVGSTGNPNGSMDFLLNLTGELGDSITNQAVQSGLISHDALLNASMTRTHLVDHALGYLGKTSASKTIKSFLERPELDNHVIKAICNNMHNDSLSHKNSKSALDDADMEQAKSYASRLVSHIVKTPDAHTLLSKMVSGLITDERAGNGALTMQRKKEMVSHLVNTVQSLDIPQNKKNSLLSSMADRLEGDAYGQMVPVTLKKMIAQNAIDSNDIDTLADIITKGDAPAAVIKQISKIFNNPSVLDNEQLISVGKILQSGKVQPKQARKVLDVMAERRDLTASQGTDPNTVLALSNNIFEGARDVLRNINEEKDSPDYFIGVLQQNAQPDSDFRAKAIGTIFQNININEGLRLSTKVKMFQTMPEIVPDDIKHVYGSRSAMALADKDVVNHPDVLKSATDGWRLAMIMNSAPHLSRDNASTVISRALAAPDSPFITPEVRYDMGAKLTESGHASDEDLNKYLRSIPAEDLVSMADKVADFGTGSNNSIHVLMPLCLDHIESTINSVDLESEFSTTGGDISTAQLSPFVVLSKMADPVMSAIDSHDDGTEVKGAKFKNASLSESRSRYIELSKQYYQKVMTFMQTKGSNDHSDAMAAHCELFRSIVNKLTYHGSASGIRYGTVESMDILNMMKYGENVERAWVQKVGGEYSPTNFAPGPSTLQGWHERCNPNADQWPEVFAQQPELVHTLRYRDNIDSGIVNAVDFDSLFKQDPEFARVTATWMDKLKSEDAPSIVHRIVDEALKATKKYGGHHPVGSVNYSESLHELVSKVIRCHPSLTCHNLPQSHRLRSRARMGSVNYSESLHELVSKVIRSHPRTITAEQLNKLPELFQGDSLERRRELQDDAIQYGAGGAEYSDKLADQYLTNWKDNVHGFDRLESIAKSPIVSDHIVSQLIDKMLADKDQQKYLNAEVVRGFAGNQNLSSRNVNALATAYKGQKQIISLLMNNGGIDQDTYFKVWEQTKGDYDNTFPTNTPFNPAFTNPKHGGALFRSLPLNIPEGVKNVDKDKLVTSAEYSVPKNRLNKLLAVMPPEGLTWMQLRQQQRDMTNLPEIKNLFLGTPNKPITPEAVAQEMTKYDGYDFHVTYSSWDGMQMHNQKSGDNLVVQLNTSAKMEAKLREDPKRWAFYQLVQKSGNHTAEGDIGGHPVTPHIASWARVDTSGGADGWVIEETQSDFDTTLRNQIDQLVKTHGNTFAADGENFTSEDLYRYAGEINEIISGWHRASLSAVEELARKQGVKQLFIHGEKVRAKLSFGGGAKNKSPVWLQKMYIQEPPKAGFQECDYSDYPVKNSTFLAEMKESELSTKCWVKKLTE